MWLALDPYLVFLVGFGGGVRLWWWVWLVDSGGRPCWWALLMDLGVRVGCWT